MLLALFGAVSVLWGLFVTRSGPGLGLDGSSLLDHIQNFSMNDFSDWNDRNFDTYLLQWIAIFCGGGAVGKAFDL